MLRRVSSPRNRVPRALGGVVFLTLLLGLPTAVRGQVREAPEFRIKAALLLNFGRYVEWPEGYADLPSGTFTIGILGQDPFGDDLNAVQGESVQGRPVEIRRFRELDELEMTHILYVSESESDRMAEVLQAVGDRPTLTVSDAADFTNEGGIIRFLDLGQRVGLEVSRGAADRAGLQISSRLLRLASIRSESRGGGG